MGNVQHITRFFTRNWQKMARPSLRPIEEYKERFNLVTYRIIITGPTICLCVECRQVIEEFINQIMVFRGGVCVGSVSGRRRCPKIEVFQYLPYYLLVSNKADDFHFPTTLLATQRICLLDLFNTLAPLFWWDASMLYSMRPFRYLPYLLIWLNLNNL